MFLLGQSKYETVWFAQLKVIRGDSEMKWLTIHHVLLNTVFVPEAIVRADCNVTSSFSQGVSPVVFVEVYFILGDVMSFKSHTPVCVASLTSVCFWLWPWTNFDFFEARAFSPVKRCWCPLNFPVWEILMWRNGPYCITLSCALGPCLSWGGFHDCGLWGLVHTCRFFFLNVK